MLDFYFSPGACSTASHIAIEESGAPYRAHQVKIHDPADPSGFRAINPKGTVPALVADGVLITENVAIFSYIGRAFPDAKLLPAGLLDQSAAFSLLGWFSSSVHISFRAAFRPDMFAPDAAAQPSVAAKGREVYWTYLTKLDALYDGKAWALGEAFSVVDCYALIFYGWGLRANLPMHELAAFTAFRDRMLARPAVRRVLEREGSVLLEAA